jgi:hypothetical protein
MWTVIAKKTFAWSGSWATIPNYQPNEPSGISWRPC